MNKLLLAHAITSTLPVMCAAYDGGEDIGTVLAEMRKSYDMMQKQMEKMGNNTEVKNLEGKVKDLNEKLDKQEEKSAELTMAIQAKKNQEAELQEQLDGLEKKMSRLKQGTEEYQETHKEIKYLESVVKSGFGFNESGEISIKGFDLTPEERKEYLRSDVNEDGGFLMNHTYEDMILKPITEISPVRQLAASRRIDALSATMFTRDALLSFTENGEGEEPWTPNNSKYGKLKIPVHSMQGTVEITNRALLGSRFNMEQEIMSDFREAQAELQNRRFVKGDGEGRPQGFMVDSRVPVSNSGTANSFDFDDLITLTGQLKTGYNPMYGMNRETLAFIRTLKDGAGNYIWREGNVGAGIPNQINGHNYTSELVDMDSVGANAEPVIFADFRRFYMIVDAFNAIMLRNPYRKDGFVRFTIESFYGGQVVMPEAGRKLRCAV